MIPASLPWWVLLPLTISGIPFFGPIGGARVGLINGEYVLNPTLPKWKKAALIWLLPAREGVLMVESEASELSEADMLGAAYGHDAMQTVIDAIIELAEVPQDPRPLPEEPADAENIGKVLGGFRS